MFYAIMHFSSLQVSFVKTLTMRVLVLLSLGASLANSTKESHLRRVKVDHGSEQAAEKIAAKEMDVADGDRRKVGSLC
jgi:hypothetical protein